MKHVFEVFSGGCELCKNTIKILKNNISTDNELIEYNLHAPIKEDVKEKIKMYEIVAVPSIIIDGKHKIVGVPNVNDIKNLLS